MLKPRSSFVVLLHKNYGFPQSHYRCLNVDSLGQIEGSKQHPDCLPSPVSSGKHNLKEIVQVVCKMMRTKPRWEQTLIDEFPSFDFSEPHFFAELLKSQTNAFLSLRFFYWIKSHYSVLPNPSSCKLLFDALLDAKAIAAAKSFCHSMGFHPDASSLERYVCCLCEVGLVEDAITEISLLKEQGIHPSVQAWNSVLLGCLKIHRTDLVWGLYKEMTEHPVAANIDVQTVSHLIQAFCDEGKAMKGYELLRQLLQNGLVPSNVTFNKLISGFSEQKNYDRMSELLHIMIEKNCAPDIYTYQEVINGLCKNREIIEAFQVFSDIKDRGYSPDLVMYTTLIHGACKMGLIGEARKLWFEMIRKGFHPNGHTYNTMIHGFCKAGSLHDATRLFQEISDSGYEEMTVLYNTLIAGYCLRGKIDEACQIFEQMLQKGISYDVITYNSLIRGFCKERKVIESRNLFEELLSQGLSPSTSSYTYLIEAHCELGDMQEAKRLWNDMVSRGLKPLSRTYDHIIKGLCKQGFIMEAVDWLVDMLKSQLKPHKKTFRLLVESLAEAGSLDDSLLVLDCMIGEGYTVDKGICHSLVNRLCKGDVALADVCLSQILESN